MLPHRFESVKQCPPSVVSQPSLETRMLASAAALEQEHTARKWCKTRGLELFVSPAGHYWRLTVPSTDGKRMLRAEWWPESAKLVFNGKYKRALEATHWPDVIAHIMVCWFPLAKQDRSTA